MNPDNHTKQPKETKDTYNTSWLPSVWAKAQQLALTPEYGGSVSALLEDLVLKKEEEERQKTLSATKRLVGQSEQFHDNLRDKQRKKS